MTAIPEKKIYTFEEYLALEEASETRYEYWDGEVFAMAGTTRRHNVLVQNLTFLLRPLARTNGCQTYAESIKQELRARSRYVYPDIIYSCDSDDVEADDELWVTNPCLLIEVLSDSTAGVDREKKREAYFRLPSLQAYVILAQDRYSAQVYQRANDFWRYELLTNPADEIRLPALGITLKLAEVYEGVRLKINP
jgi:Uma2 family endonuclease